MMTNFIKYCTQNYKITFPIFLILYLVDFIMIFNSHDNIWIWISICGFTGWFLMIYCEYKNWFKR